MDTKLSWDGHLETWGDVWKSCKKYQKEHGGKIGLLIGNGASCAVWAKFDYHSLYDIAKSGDYTPSLSSLDKTIFDQMKTEDFEQVLYDLWIAKMVCGILGQPSPRISERYDHIKQSLIAAVHSVHIRYSSQLEQQIEKIQEALLDYEVIYTTNYDLLLY
ncbi:MAG TPA: DUF4917 family protein, partial [Ktedonobacterales bacterium]|nr:DUF4917 family protein [Ktedonobacterales bacterium]